MRIRADEEEPTIVARAIPNSLNELETIKKAVESSSGAAYVEHLVPSKIGRPVIFDGPQSEVERINLELEKNGLKSKILSDGQKEEEKEKYLQSINRNDLAADEINLHVYNDYDTIMDYLDSVAEENSDIINLKDVGKSHEGRRLVKLTIGTSPKGDQTRAIFIDGGIHAREWISPATALILIEKLKNAFRAKVDQGKDDIRTHIDYHIMPLVNPDGYQYSRLSNATRMWRKNRRKQLGQLTSLFSLLGIDCYGVDLNRNVDVIGFGVGASKEPCSNMYRGPKRNSEPETVALIGAINKNRKNIRLYLTLHSIGQKWLTSFGYKTNHPVDVEKLRKMGRAFTSKMEKVNGRKYEIETAGEYYPAGGASDDFAKIVAKIPYSATLELPDRANGKYGFRLPSSKIEGVGEEVWEGLKGAIPLIKKEPLGDDVFWEKQQAKNREEEEQELNRLLDRKG